MLASTSEMQMEELQAVREAHRRKYEERVRREELEKEWDMAREKELEERKIQIDLDKEYSRNLLQSLQASEELDSSPDTSNVEDLHGPDEEVGRQSGSRAPMRTGYIDTLIETPWWADLAYAEPVFPNRHHEALRSSVHRVSSSSASPRISRDQRERELLSAFSDPERMMRMIMNHHQSNETRRSAVPTINNRAPHPLASPLPLAMPSYGQTRTDESITIERECERNGDADLESGEGLVQAGGAQPSTGGRSAFLKFPATINQGINGWQAEHRERLLCTPERISRPSFRFRLPNIGATLDIYCRISRTQLHRIIIVVLLCGALLCYLVVG